jgi:hypothetical protein
LLESIDKDIENSFVVTDKIGIGYKKEKQYKKLWWLFENTIG